AAAAPLAAPDAAPPNPGIGVFAVPPATGNNAVITVKVGGDRVSTSGVTPLAGVTLRLYDGTSAPTTPVADSWATCVSDAAGDCSFVVPNTQTGTAGVNRDRRFWVVQTGTAAGWFANTSLVTGGDPFATTAYRFQTGSQLRAGSTYASSGVNASFMLGTGNENAVASGGIWQNSRNNPTLPAKCGLNVALIIDTSGSVGAALPNLKTAAKTFTNSLVGTPSQLALFTFATTAPANSTNNQNRPLTPVSTTAGAATVNGWIDGLTSTGGTNWDRGFAQVAQSGSTYDVAVVITDGNPTFYNNPVEGPGYYTRFREMENGIFSANAIKANGTRMIAFGVGSGVSGPANNLIAVSGPTLNSDYYQTTDYAVAGAALRALALGNCRGSVSVIKQVVPSTAPVGSITGAVPAGGWQFAASTTTSGVTIAPASGATAAGTGALSFALTFPGGTTSAQVAVSETQQPGYTLVPVSGANAVCTNLQTNTAITVTNSGATGFTVPTPSTDPLSCTVYNRQPNPGATISVAKKWVVNGTSYDEGLQPAGLSASLSIAGAAQGWGVPRTGFQQGNTVSFTESTSISLLGCTLTGNRVTLANGTVVDAALPYSATLVAGANTYTVTNTVTCTTRLTLNKTVRGGTALPSAWTLTATAPSGAAAGPTGTSGVTATVTPGARYVLSETGGTPIYAQLAGANAVPIPGSTVSWNCSQVANDGTTPVPGFSDGLNGGVTPPLGAWIQCTAINETVPITLIKRVVNDNGGTAVPSDWSLTATPIGTVPPGLNPVTVTGSTAGVTFNIRPGQQYSLTEAGPAGYSMTIDCVISELSPARTDVVSVPPGQTGVCTFTNDDQPARLTLTKVVNNGTTGGTATPANWTLTATGPTPGVSGITGAPAVTNATVNSGTYALSESALAGYTAGSWSCTGATVTGASVVVPPGGNVSCSITNTAQQARLTLVKTVTNDNGGTATPPQWQLVGTGPTPIQGPTGGGAVTNAAVNPGTYVLSESGGPAGYTAGPWSCTGTGTLTGASLVLALGQSATCTINNNDQPATLTLVKTVTNNNGGTAAAAAWTLSAGGPTPITGTTGSAAVTNAQVSAGTYTLSESNGPAGYTAGSWSCTAGTLTGASLVLALGQSATCTINNDDQPATLTLVKTVTNDNGGTALPTAWNLTATGPTTITGVTGSATVTSAAVSAGTYALSEANGPAGYTAGSWSCTAGTLTGSSL
ncbi:MAG TPA: hypothetical protein VIJ00_18475, partial [Nakamurella sp.]